MHKASTLAIALAMHVGSLSAPKALADKSRVQQVITHARGIESRLHREILAHPELRQELGVTDNAGRGAVFKYDLAFQETHLQPATAISSGTIGEEIIEESSRVIIPFCHERTCLFAEFDDDPETQEIVIVSYGGSARASRFAEAHSRLKALRPQYRGPVAIIEYPEGKLDFLMVDAEDGSGKVFLPATEGQAARLQAESMGPDFFEPARLAQAIQRLDDIARSQRVDEEAVARQIEADHAARSAPLSEIASAPASLQAPAKAPASPASTPDSGLVTDLPASIATTGQERLVPFLIPISALVVCLGLVGIVLFSRRRHSLDSRRT